MKIFAEIGLNHLGNSNNAIKLVNKCLKLNVDGITLQIQPEFYYDNSKNFRRALEVKTYKKISSILRRQKKLFGLAIMDVKTLEKFSEVKFDFFKILSLGFQDAKLIDRAIKTKKKIFVSTGFSDLNSIVKLGKKYPKINFIHTSLDLQAKDANLSAISAMKKKIRNKVSYGFHSTNLEILFISVSYLPDSIFFYIKPNEKKNYPDNEHAISLKNLPKVLKLIRISKESLGNGLKIKRKVPDWVYE